MVGVLWPAVKGNIELSLQSQWIKYAISLQSHQT
jgi:hypothetical protein